MGIAVRGGSVASSSANAVARLVNAQMKMFKEQYEAMVNLAVTKALAPRADAEMQVLVMAENQSLKAENMQLKTDLAIQKGLVEVERGATQLQKKECERLHKELAQQSRTSAEKEGLAEVSFKRREREANDRVATAGREVDQWKESYNVLEKERDELEKKNTELKRRMKKKGVRMESTDDELEGAMNAPEADDYDDDMV